MNSMNTNFDGGGAETGTIESIAHRIRYYQHQAPMALAGIASQISTLNAYFSEFNTKFDELDMLTRELRLAESRINILEKYLEDCRDESLLRPQDHEAVLSGDVLIDNQPNDGIGNDTLGTKIKM
ncbi:MAG: hypothetical protein WBC91_03225 [Phototrophicaceae bacterium]